MNDLFIQKDRDAIIGIVGGMGPRAGVELFNRILDLSPATTDQEHLPVMLMSLPGWLPDRTLFLEGKESENPAFAVISIIQKLETAGAGIIGIACNTCHGAPIFQVILNGLRNTGSRVKLLSMPDETGRYLGLHFSKSNRVGIMSTDGTYKAGIYGDPVRQMGYELVLPPADFQHNIIHRMIYDPVFGIKSVAAGITQQVLELLNEALAFFKYHHCDVIILGCTELSLLRTEISGSGMHVIDSTDCLARALIESATAPLPATGYKNQYV